jgi:hypothetical protein
VAAVQREGRVDLEAVEQAVKKAVLAAGAGILGQLLHTVGVGRRKTPVVCTCGARMKSHGVKGTQVQTLLGWIGFERSLFECPCCGKIRYPGDEELDIVHTSRSPGVRRQAARLGAKETFAQAALDFKELAGIEVCRKEAERIAEEEGVRMEAWMEKERHVLRFQAPPENPLKTIETLYIELDGTGIPMVQEALEGRKGKQPDGSAKTREAKTGCVFTRTMLDEEGKPIRDPASTSFVAAIETAAVFGGRLYAEAVRRGLFNAKHIVVLGDGAEWIANIAETHFSQAQFIVDYYHAAEHVGELCRALFDRDSLRLKSYRDKWTGYLWNGQVEILIQEATALLPKDPGSKKEARTQIGYFEKKKNHMQYEDYRNQHLFIGSGVVEAACKTLVGARLKQSGMEWTIRGANAVLALRSVVLSNRMEEYWEDRQAA